ncbi:MAG: thermonuclease family protein [Azoarcus sp.]|jgi:endonuclease YncB( thermonuclease family)|nr:thermonuclease family protein [Azoarcus sp.]
MKTLRHIVGTAALLSVVGLSAPPCVAAPRTITGQVIKVADGDTLTLRNTRGKKIRVRLVGIDAPEKCQPFGQHSRASLAELALGRHARVEVVEVDRYGRSVGLVRTGDDGETLNRIQLRRGLAWVYARYNRDASLHALAREARNARRGLWADERPVEPWRWRRQYPGGKGCRR